MIALGILAAWLDVYDIGDIRPTLLVMAPSRAAKGEAERDNQPLEIAKWDRCTRIGHDPFVKLRDLSHSTTFGKLASFRQTVSLGRFTCQKVNPLTVVLVIARAAADADEC